MCVIVRDWLSANHVLFLADHDNVLIDSGYGARVADTVAHLTSGHALGEKPLHRIVNTHIHSDHVGGNAALKRRYGCSVTVPAAEAEIIRAWDTRALLLDYADQRCERFEVDHVVHPGDMLELAGEPWQAIAAPGHDMGALMFYSPAARILISGDALWANGFGFIEPHSDSTACLDAAAVTLAAIARLDVALVIPGHGQPFTDVSAALERANSRVAQFRREPDKMVWYALKAFFMFSLLDRGQVPVAGLARYLGSVPVFRDWTTTFLGMRTEEAAAILLADLKRSLSVRIEDGFVRPR
jgi:glyoxylase-like metal-dependent hydrolase (beta-lactamase superfamily II)